MSKKVTTVVVAKRKRVVATINTKAKAKPVKNTKPLVLNSPSDVWELFKREADANQLERKALIESAVSFTSQMALKMNAGTDTSMIRADLLRMLVDGPKDIDAECGYPTWLTPEHYRRMYDREGIAKRVVDCMPEETWALDPEIFEDEDESTETPFEKAFDSLCKRMNAISFLQRIDILSGVGQYGLLLIGIDDGKELSEPVANVETELASLNDTDSGSSEEDTDDEADDDGTDSTVEDDTEDGSSEEFTPTRKVLYFRVFDESAVFVKLRETDAKNPRYGQPISYNIQFRDYPNWGTQAGETISKEVHWTRVIHVADNRKMSEIFGVPRQQPVYNRLYDLRKVYAASGEAFWKGAFPGLSFEVNPEVADQGVEIDQESLKEQMDRFSAGTQRYIATTGLSTKTIPPEVVDPTATIETHLKAIAIALAIPYRVLFGSEEAKLAGNSDTRAWNRRLSNRQTKYVSPMIIRPFVDRLIAMGVLPEPDGEYTVEWPDLNALSDQDKAAVALTKTQALQAYIMGNGAQLVPPDLFLTLFMGMTTEEAQQILEAVAEQMPDELSQGDNALNPEDSASDNSEAFMDDSESGEPFPRPGAKPAGKVPPQFQNNTGWTDAAREASILARQANAHGDSDNGKGTTQDGGDGSGSPGRGILHPAGKGAFSTPLKGASEAITPNPHLREVAASYAASAKLPYHPHAEYIDVDPARAKKISVAYEAMKHDPTNPEVAKSYAALKTETKAQWDAATKAGYKIEPWMEKGEPYKNSAAMRDDVANNKHLWFFPTESGFGTKEMPDNPLLESAGVTVNGEKLVYNDLFRGVHDLFGHAKDGVGFGPRGEENVWASHSSMFSDAALPAMTSETRGQNSWVNFGPNAKHNREHKDQTIFAEQKTGLLPKEFYERPKLVVNSDTRKRLIVAVIKNGKRKR